MDSPQPDGGTEVEQNVDMTEEPGRLSRLRLLLHMMYCRRLSNMVFMILTFWDGEQVSDATMEVRGFIPIVRIKNYAHQLPESYDDVYCNFRWQLLIDFLEHGATINAQSYVETLQKMKRAIKQNDQECWRTGLILFHDNARPYTVQVVSLTREDFRW